MSKRIQLGGQLEGSATSAGGESLPSEIARDRSLLEITPSRLSLQRCRSILGPACKLTDSQVLKLRDALYDLANVALEGGRSRMRLQ